jgi:hypothetical protein
MLMTTTPSNPVQSCQPITDAPHVPAAFINAIAEEGTKDEAIFWLQKQWNECCALRAELKALRGDAYTPWMPIETAPRDGTPILVCNSRHQSHAPVAVRWLDEMSNPDTGWCDAATASGDALYYNAKYFDWWMPLPALPSSVTSTDRGGE